MSAERIKVKPAAPSEARSAKASAPAETKRTPPRPTQRYDLAVVGTELAGLVAGALLAKRGLRVLHVDHERPHSHYISGGYLLPTKIDLLPPLRAIPALRGLFDELGTLPSTNRMLQPYGQGLQIALAGARFILAADPAARKRELARAFGDEAQGLEAALEGGRELREKAGAILEEAPLPPLGFFERRRALKLLRRGERASQELAIRPDARLGSALFELHSHLSPLAGEASSLGFLRGSLAALLEPSRFEGGGLVELMRAAIKGHRGDLIGSPEAPARVEEIVLERGRFVGLRLEGQPSPYLARHCIAAVDGSVLLDALPPSRARRRLERLEEGIVPIQRIFTTNLILAEEGIPPGMGSLVFASGLGPVPILIRLEATRRSDGKEAPKLRTATVSAVVPVNETQEAAEAMIAETLEEVMPFHQGHLEHRSVGPGPFLRYEPSGKAEEAALLGGSLHEPIGRLLVANAAVLPGLGLEGAVLTGTRAARLAEEKIRKVKAS